MVFCISCTFYAQLPDYHDIIKHPMDFSTIRNKLSNGNYANLEQFEVRILLLVNEATYIIMNQA